MPKKSKPLSQEVIKRLQELFKQKEVLFAYLFDSRAEESNTSIGPLSDYDFGR